MFKVQTLNKISSSGLDLLPRDMYEVASEFTNPDAIILRSFKMNDMELPASLKAVARAGAGVNNIPIDKCSEKGIVVFNTPGANANGVKELVILGLLLASRKVFQGLAWAKSLIGKGDEIPQLVEKGKSQFTGPEILGKKLGIIGLGAIGCKVANDAHALGMKVKGYDPFITIDSAWLLSNNVQKASGLEEIFRDSDYISINVPFNDETKGMFNAEKFALMKKGVRILNFARGGLVNNPDLLKAIDQGIVTVYVTDFPDEELLKNDNVIGLPHLGASTPEAEDNCAVMAANQLRSFMETGNIKNSVNYPACEMEFSGKSRLLIMNKNVPQMVGKITGVLAEKQINISNLLNKHK
ncbi:3-phosphoglycerate dehydrogenase, partial [candidate division KSB1 bacterium]|nr:3-phosphoglycerate dehydrogenase [candidate division KSB1 bacterium]